MPEKFVIRYARRADAPVIMEMIRELADYMEMLEEVVTTEELLTEWLFEKRTAEVLLAEEMGKPVGFAIFYHNFSTYLGKGGIHLEDLYVKPQTRGKGYGRRLLKKLAEIAVERDCARLEWNCLDWNKPSIAFYLSLGAVPMDEWTTYRVDGDALYDLAGE